MDQCKCIFNQIANLEKRKFDLKIQVTWLDQQTNVDEIVSRITEMLKSKGVFC